MPEERTQRNGQQLNKHKNGLMQKHTKPQYTNGKTNEGRAQRNDKQLHKQPHG